VRAPTISLLLLAGLILGCAYNGDRLECGGQEAMLRAVFEYQFENNRSAIGREAAAYFIGMENGQDPEPGFLQSFGDHEPRVAPLSEAGRTDNRVIDSQTGRPALIFEIQNVTESDDGATLIETGYYEAELSASWITLQGRCEGDQWLIEAVGPEMLS
jgi:hypothetical protein